MNSRRILTGLWQKGAICLVLLGISLGVCRAQIGIPPIILLPPLGLSVQNGGTAHFTVGLAVSLSPLSYQWRFNGVNIQGATDSSLTVTNVRSGTAGKYSVVVKNASGTTVSGDALLVVLGSIVTGVVDPVISVLSSALNTNGFTLHLTVPAGSNYVVSASSGLGGWTPIATNASLTGSVDFTDTDAVNHATRFYRVQLR